MKIKVQHNARPPVIILAAGLSKRMGALKPFLLWDKKLTFLQKIMNEYVNFGSRKIVIVVNNEVMNIIRKDFPELENKARIIINTEPEKGKFLSLKMGLSELEQADNCFIQNVDNPFIDKALLDRMAEKGDLDGYVVPTYNGKRGHPILAGRKVLDHLLSVEDKDHDLRILMNPFRKIIYNTDNSRILLNINSEKDYGEIFGSINKALK